MTTADSYRNIAAKLRAAALKAPDNASAAQLDSLALCYLRLAEQADMNRLSDVWAEFGSPPRLEGGDA